MHAYSCSVNFHAKKLFFFFRVHIIGNDTWQGENINRNERKKNKEKWLDSTGMTAVHWQCVNELRMKGLFDPFEMARATKKKFLIFWKMILFTVEIMSCISAHSVFFTVFFFVSAKPTMTLSICSSHSLPVDFDFLIRW